MLKILRKHFFLILMFLLIIPSFWKITRPGFFPMQDDMQVFKLLEMNKCLSDFQIPCRWVPDAGYGYGYPMFNYYPPGVYYLGQVIRLFGFQYIDIVKILFILGFVAGAYLMFIFIQELFGPQSALVASVLYTFAPYRAMQVYVRGSLSEFWGVSLFPFALWSSYMLIKRKEKKYFFIFSLSIFFLLITHSLLPLIFFPILFIWIGYLIFTERIVVKKFREVFFSFLSGCFLSAFFTIPLVLEKKYVHAETLLSGYFDYRRHFVDLYQMFVSNHFGYGSSDLGPGDDLSLSTGRVLLIAGMLGIIFAVLNFKKNRKASMLVFAASLVEILVLFMMHLKSFFMWETVTVLQWLQFPWRLLSLSILILSLISGALIYFGGKYKYYLTMILILLAFWWHVPNFTPKSWQNISDEDKFSGEYWERQLTVSIGDYLPISADLPPNQKAPEVPEVLEGDAKINDFQKHSHFQLMNIELSEASLIRVPFFDFPGIKVFSDGKEIPHFSNECRLEDFCFGLVSFKLDSGVHNVKVILINTPVRTFANLLSLTGLVGLMIYFFYGKIKNNY